MPSDTETTRRIVEAFFSHLSSRRISEILALFASEANYWVSCNPSHVPWAGLLVVRCMVVLETTLWRNSRGLHDSDVGCPVSSHISPSTSLCLPALALVGVLGWRVNYFAASSALSLPSTPACAGVHLKLVCTPFSSSLYINLVIIIIWACFEPWL
jgi:hypothetical protein